MTATGKGWEIALGVLTDVGRLALADREPALSGLPVALMGGEPDEEQRAQAEKQLAAIGITLEWGMTATAGQFGEVLLVRLSPPASEPPP